MFPIKKINKCKHLHGNDLGSKVDHEALELCRILNDNNKECYLVGGTVRDLILGKHPKDIDITTDATPEEMVTIFETANEKVVPTGIQHGTITVIKNSKPFEITTYRTESGYSDGRRPDEVTFVKSLEEDLKRRDLTINALAYDPINDEIIDCHDGISDLTNRRIRAVGDPLSRFKEDLLRPFRACRFASKFDFTIDHATKQAITTVATATDKISRERIRDELMKILTSNKPSIGINCLEETGLLTAILPDITALKNLEQPKKYHVHDAYQHTLVVLDYIPSDKPLLRLAALFHDIGKKATKTITPEGEIHFIGHEDTGAIMSEQIMQELKFSNHEIEYVKNLIKYHMGLPANIDEWKDSTLRKFIGKVGEADFNDLLVLRRADVSGHGQESEKRIDDIFEKIRARITSLSTKTPGKTTLTLKDLVIKGEDVMQTLNIPPSNKIGILLNHLLETIIENPELNTRDQLIPILKAKYQQLV